MRRFEASKGERDYFMLTLIVKWTKAFDNLWLARFTQDCI